MNLRKLMRGYSAFVAIDSFKGSLSTEQANEAVKQALLKKGFDESEIHCFPVADGGEGFCSVIASYIKTKKLIAEVKAPLGNTVKAEYLLADDGTAYLETATACGYTLVPAEKRNPFLSSSFGMGQLMLDAVRNGAKKLVIGLGGTATSDGGLGALQALGVRFYFDPAISVKSAGNLDSASGIESAGNLDKAGSHLSKPDSVCPQLPDGAPALLQPITGMDLSALDNWKTPVELWSDTNSVYYGENSAMRMYGKQKGLKPEDVARADDWMKGLTALFANQPANQLSTQLGNQLSKQSGNQATKRLSNQAGTGAAGGLGGALYLLPGAVMKAGADGLLDLASFREKLRTTEPKVGVVFSGEGKFDEQTVTGKLPSRVANAVIQEQKNTGRHIMKVCVCGCAELKETDLFDRIIPITPAGMPLEEALRPEVAAKNMINAICEEKSI